MVNNYRISTSGTPILVSDEEAGTSYALVVAFFCNTSTQNYDNLSLYVVKNGQSHSNNNIVLKDYPIAPADTLELDTEKIIVSDGDYVLAKCTKGTVTATVSYMEV